MQSLIINIFILIVPFIALMIALSITNNLINRKIKDSVYRERYQTDVNFNLGFIFFAIIGAAQLIREIVSGDLKFPPPFTFIFICTCFIASIVYLVRYAGNLGYDLKNLRKLDGETLIDAYKKRSRK